MFEQTDQTQGSSNARKVLVLLFLPAIVVVAGYVFFTHTSPTSVNELTGILREGDPEYEAYKELVVLKNSRIQMGLNFNRKRVVMFSGEIENRGDRTLDVVELKIMYFNYEEHIDTVFKIPIRPGPYTKPVEPLTSGSYNFYIEDFPNRWKGSECEVYINGFRFAD